jgi:uncharacterized delta-60 repeat protein
LLSAGDLDPSFGTGGKVLTDFTATSSDNANALALQGDGKIVVVGSTNEVSASQSRHLALVRYNTDGTLDNTFGTGGKVMASASSVADRANGVVIQPDGKIVVVGLLGLQGSAIRYNTDGSLDSTFGTGGITSGLPTGVGGTGPAGVALQADGKVVVVSVDSENSSLTRLNTDGTVERSFHVILSSAHASPFTRVVVQPDGKIVASGAGVARVNPDGSFDVTFGTNGVVSQLFGNTFIDGKGLALQGDGKILASANLFGRPLFSLARLNTNGTADTTFGTNGLVSTGGIGDTIVGIVVQPDGRIVAAGSSGSQIAVARYNPNGSLDTTYGTGGRVLTSVGSIDIPSGVIVQPDSKIVVTSSSTVSSPSAHVVIAVVRYLGDDRTGTQNQRFVAQVYLDLLQRPADPGGLTFWTGMLNQGSSRTQVALGIENSQEYHALTVQGLYGFLLKRPVDPVGLSGWTNFLAQGNTAEQLESLLIGSPEYFLQRAGGNNTTFIQAVYGDVLQRPPDSGGALLWGQALIAGVPRSTVAAMILGSVESDMLEVQTLYGRFLRRRADNSGLTGFTNMLQQGGSNEQVIAAIVGSDEYFGRV